MLIATGSLTRQTLAGQVAVVTGAGGGIGFEAARALIWLGAHVVIAELDAHKGKDAVAQLDKEFGADAATFVQTDVGDERSVNRLAQQAARARGKVDIVLNNATVAALGAVKDVAIKDWDTSYRVNLRGPVLLAQTFLPGMLERNSGVFVCVSSYGLAYMGAYEILKKAQVELATTLDAELEKTGVSVFTIGPGAVSTQTFETQIARLAPMMGKTLAEFREIVKDHVISVEAAGAGFAAAIARADHFRGQEIGSTQALLAAGIDVSSGNPSAATLTPDEMDQALTLCRKMRATLSEQAAGWKQRSVFEYQWVIRDFKKQAGMPVEQWQSALEALEQCLAQHDAAGLLSVRVPVRALAGYYGHLQDLARGYA